MGWLIDDCWSKLYDVFLGKTGSARTDILRAAKALVVTETIVVNSTVYYGTIPDSIKQYMP